MADTEDKIKKEVTVVLDTEKTLEQELGELQIALAANKEFTAFMQKQTQLREAQKKSDAFWKEVEARMIKNGIKSVKGDWGSLTIAERTTFTFDEEVLPKKFFKRSIDTTKVLATYKLEGSVKGATPIIKLGLQKRLK